MTIKKSSLCVQNKNKAHYGNPYDFKLIAYEKDFKDIKQTINMTCKKQIEKQNKLKLEKIQKLKERKTALLKQKKMQQKRKQDEVLDELFDYGFSEKRIKSSDGDGD